MGPGECENLCDCERRGVVFRLILEREQSNTTLGQIEIVREHRLRIVGVNLSQT
jgi:hypothetical protein